MIPAELWARSREGYEVINLKRFIFYLSESHSRTICAGDKALSSHPPELIVQNAESGGSIALSRAVFFEIGGYDEALVAGEDCNLFYRLQKMGKMLFLKEIEVHHSPRRFRKYGYWKVSYLYFMEGISRLFAKKSFAREWKVVR